MVGTIEPFKVGRLEDFKNIEIKGTFYWLHTLRRLKVLIKLILKPSILSPILRNGLTEGKVLAKLVALRRVFTCSFCFFRLRKKCSSYSENVPFYGPQCSSEIFQG